MLNYSGFQIVSVSSWYDTHNGVQNIQKTVLDVISDNILKMDTDDNIFCVFGIQMVQNTSFLNWPVIQAMTWIAN